LRGLVDRLDPLPDPTEVPLTVALVLAIRTTQPQPHRSGRLFEILTGETFIRHQDLSITDEMMVALKQRGQHLTFPDFRVRQAPHDRHPISGAHQVQLQAPVVPRMRRTVTIARVSGKVGPLHRFP
jgi:hypothetical protein